MHYSFAAREYDPVYGRFWSVDPMAIKAPWNSSYAFAENRVIDGIDFQGARWLKYDARYPNVIVFSTQALKGDNEHSRALKAAEEAKINIIIADNLEEINRDLAETSRPFSYLLIFGHGASAEAAQVIGVAGWSLLYLKQWRHQLREIGSHIKPDGALINLGCFTSNPEIKGREYIQGFARLLNRNVVGNAGSTKAMGASLFKQRPLGTTFVSPNVGNDLYIDRANRWKGIWFGAAPNGLVVELGNIKLDEKGNPSTPANEETSHSKENNKLEKNADNSISITPVD